MEGHGARGQGAQDPVDFSDLLPTFAELGGGQLPSGTVFDGMSLAAQFRGQPGPAREWIFVQLGPNWYVRDAGWKLTNRSELLDVSNAPYVEKSVPADTQGGEAAAARKRLQAVLDQLAPDKGKTEPPSTGEAKKKRKRARQVNP